MYLYEKACVSQTDYTNISLLNMSVCQQESKVEVYRKMWNHMAANFDRVMVNNTPTGVEMVRNNKGEYAFLMEEAYNKYHNQRKPCNTMMVGNNLDNKGYGIATPVGFYLK